MPLKRMTLMGTETYLNQMSPSPKSISDNWQLDNEHFNKQTLLATIVMTGGRFEPLYSDPEYYRFMSAQWWNKWQRSFQRWFDALDIEYNPLENYDRMENWHEDTTDGESSSTEYGSTTTLDHDGAHVVGGTDKTVVDDDNETQESGTTKTVTDQDGTDTESGTTRVQTDDDSKLRAPGASGSNSSTTTNSISAYDSSSYQPKDQSVTNTNRSEDTERDIDQSTTHGLKHTTTNDVDETITHGKKVVGKDDSTTTKTWSESGTDNADDQTDIEGTSATDRSYDRDFDHEGRVHGNIGVTTSQQMLQSELDLQLWNVYQHMADIFCKELLITVY